MENPAENRFQKLKITLDSLGYYQPVTIESTALVEKLLRDLLNATTGFQTLKKQHNQALAELESERTKIIPLSHENEKVVKDNNQLHQEIIR